MIARQILKAWTADIRFWIWLYFLIRLFGITNPPLEVAHNWRQTTGLMVARNFYEIDDNIFYPRLDMAGEKSGITGTEFPLLNYLMYLMALLFGWADWYGRLINLIVTSIGIYFYNRLIAGFLRRDLAFYSTFILLNSLWFVYARKTMPDTFSLAIMMPALWYGLDYLRRGGWWRLFLFAFLALCSVLSKIPSAFLLGVFLLPFLDKRFLLHRKVLISLSGVLLMLPVGIWYFYWVPLLVERYGFWHYYMGTGLREGALDLYAHIGQAAEKFYFRALGYVGFGLFLAGLVMAAVRRERALLWLFAICSGLFFIFMMKAGFAFYHHTYYIMPFVPVMALMAGYAIVRAPKSALRLVLLVALAAETIGNGQDDFFIPKREAYKLRLEPLAARYTQKDERIAINCDKNPQQIYLSHRKGWNLTNEEASSPAYMQQLQQKGLKLLIINQHEGTPPISFKKVEEDEDFIVYRL